jgi:hypothetical protein
MSDRPEWFTSPEHAHIVGVDDQLAGVLRAEFGIPGLKVDCGVEGTRSYTYHFRIYNVPADLRPHVSTRAMDLLSSYTGYRFEVYCV